MKNIFNLIVLFSILLTTFSCDNDSLSTENNDLRNTNNFKIDKKIKPEDILLYNSIIELNFDEQRVALTTLNPNQRYNIWLLKLQNFKENNLLNKNQLNLINDLQSDLNEKLFTNNDEKNKEKLIFLNEKRDFYLNKAIELFGKNEGIYLLTKIENINQTIIKIKDKIKTDKVTQNSSNSKNAVRSCNCEKDRECIRLTGVGLDGFSWEWGTCTNSNCYVQVYFGLWESDNIGRCIYN